MDFTEILREGLPFNRTDALGSIELIYNNLTSTSPNWKFFILNSQGSLAGDNKNPLVTIEGCHHFAGTRIGWYSDRGPRLIVWFLPIMVLLANFQFSPVGKRRYLSLCHILGNPIGSVVCLLLKTESWNRSFAQAHHQLYSTEDSVMPIPNYGPIYGFAWTWRKKSATDKADLYKTKRLGLVIEAVKEVCGCLGHSINMNTDFSSIFATGDIQAEGIQTHISICAQTLVNSRTFEIRRTTLSIILYIIGVLAGFVPALGADNGPSGGELGPALLLSWILPLVLLSNVVGDYVSPSNNLNAVQTLLESLHPPPNNALPILDEALPLIQGAQILAACRKVSKTYYAELAISGALNTTRFNRVESSKASPTRTKWLFFLVSWSIVIGFVMAFIVLDTPPSDFSCRHPLIIAIFLLWVASPGFSHYIGVCVSRSFKLEKKDEEGEEIFFLPPKFPSMTITPISTATSPSSTSSACAKRQFIYITLKDSLIALFTFTMLVASSCGLFNTCTCWIGLLKKDPVARINPLALFAVNVAKRYPIAVGLSLGLQGVMFLLFLGVGGRGVRMVWWSGKEAAGGVSGGRGELIVAR